MYSEDELKWGFHIEEVPQFSEHRILNLLDMDCFKLETALKAVWILYRRGKWELLRSIGLPRGAYEAQFISFDMQYITSDHGLLRTVDQAELFADVIPGVRIAAMLLIELYKSVYMDRRTFGLPELD